MVSFEEKFPEIKEIVDRVVSKYWIGRSWLMSGMTGKDAKQVVFLRIWQKWNYWDQTRPLGPYIDRIAKNTLINLKEKEYSGPPCFNINGWGSKCPHNLGSPSFHKCSIGGCEKYDYYIKSKLRFLDIVNADIAFESWDEEEEKRFREDILKIVGENLTLDFKHYFDLFFVKGLSPKEIVKNEMFFKKRVGHRQMNNIRKKIGNIIREIVGEEVLGFVKFNKK